MEYYRDQKNLIQADMAYRLGIVAWQYSNLSLPEDKKFSSTLNICILQNLLTNCITLLESMSRAERHRCYLTADLENQILWGLNPGMIEINTFRTPRLTAAVVLRHIRNALSHPTQLDPETSFPSTGYTTLSGGSGRIHEYCFVSSPDTKRNQPRKFSTKEQALAYLERRKGDGSMPDDITIITTSPSEFSLGQMENLFARVFKIRLNTQEIHELVMGLSNHLSQPIQEQWDGRTIKQLVA